jgi:hypothetical protein
VAFDGSRDVLRNILSSLDLMAPDADIDALFEETEQDWHWGSLIRCTLAGWDNTYDTKTGAPKGWSSASNKVGKAYRDPEAQRFPKTCTQTWLSDLPDRLQLVILLGNADSHIKNVRQTISHMYPIEPVPGAADVAFKAGGVTWVHVVHPSGAARGSHAAFQAADETTTSGAKGAQARRAVAQSGVFEPA